MIRQSAIVVAGLVAMSAAYAHHGFGNFAMNEDIEFTGVITKLAFVNPHSWLYFNVTEPDGNVAEYRCEMRSATTLRRSGWTPEMFPAGAEITIQGSPDRAEPRACYVSTLVFADGSSLDRYGQRIPAVPAEAATRAARLSSGEPNIFGDWAQEQVVMTDPRGQRGTLVPLSRVGEFAPGDVPEGQRQIPGARGTEEAVDGRNPFAGGQRPRVAAVKLTPAGEAAMAALDLGPRAARSCQNTSILADWAGEPVNRIAQENGAIKLSYGRLGLERTIDMSASEHPLRSSQAASAIQSDVGKAMCSSSIRSASCPGSSSARRRIATSSASSSGSSSMPRRSGSRATTRPRTRSTSRLRTREPMR